MSLQRLGLLAALWLAIAVPAWAQEEFVCAGYLARGPSSSGGAAKPLVESRSPQGHLQALVVFAGFPDEVAAYPFPPSYAGSLLDPAKPGSVAHFYDLMSFGQLQIRGQVLPRRYACDDPPSAYLSTSPGLWGEYGRFVTEVLRKADAEVDFGQFDDDGPDGVPNSGDDDGVVDYLFVDMRSVPHDFIFKGANGVVGLGFDEFTTNDLTPAGRPVRISGAAAHGALEEEGTFSQTAGSMAHEFGHALGLTDLYDLGYDSPADDSGGVGRWDLMGWGAHGWTGDDGPNALGAASLEQLGWIGRGNDHLVLLREHQSGLVVQDLFQGGRVYKVYLPARQVPGTPRVSEQVEPGYLLLEQRVRSAHYYNRHLPAEGLLLWHVQPGVPTNDEEESKRVDLVCADGLYADAGYFLGRNPDPGQGRDNLDFWAHDGTYTQAHAGNLGDATDPFDGVRYSGFNSRTNPAIQSVGDFAAAALSPLLLRFQRRGESMSVEVDPPRWGGVIQEEVHWAGDVLVDGDLEIAPQGSLVIHPDTRVWFAPEDRLHAGEDPQQCELRVEGSLHILSEAHLTLAGQQPGQSWYGVLFDPVPAARVEVPSGSLDIRDASHGLVMPGAPPGTQGLTLASSRLLDAPSEQTAGNGDGQLQPGESFQLRVEVANWSMSNYPQVRARFSWRTTQLLPTWTSAGSSAASDISSYSETFSLAPGARHRLKLPSLTLDSQIQAGARVAMTVHLSADRQAGDDTLAFVVQPASPIVDLDLAIAGQTGSPVVASAADTVAVQARLRQGSVEAIDLVVWRLPQGGVLGEIPMRRRASDSPVFDAVFHPPATGQYELVPRLRQNRETIHFSTSRSQVAVPFDSWCPLLVLAAPRIAQGTTELYTGALRTAFANLKEDATFLVPTPAMGPWQDALLDHYLGLGRVVIWVGGSLPTATQRALARYLDRGGHLLIFSSAVPSWSDSLKARLPLAQARAGRMSGLQGQGSMSSLSFSVYHAVVEGLQAPAEPLFADADGQVAGLLADNGTYRLIYLLFGLSDVPAAAQQPLVERLLGQLQLTEPLVVEKVQGLVPDPLSARPLIWPRLFLANPSAQSSPPFIAVFQVLQDARVLARFERAVPPLRAGSRREVALPAWTPPGEMDYRLELALLSTSRSDTFYTLTQPLRVIQAQGQFVRVPAVADSLSNGAALFDYDNDGDLDLYLVRLGVPNRLWRNDGDHFTEVGAAAGLDCQGQGRGLALGDFDGDGDLDLYLVQEGPNRLFRNEGDGTFSDQSAALDADPRTTHPLADPGAGRSAAFFDADLDGDLDLFLVDSGAPNRLWRNDGGRFAEVADTWGLAETHSGRGLAVGDFDGDGDPDLFVANLEAGASRLYRNDGDRFVDGAAALGLQPDASAVGGVFGDYDNDGDLDLFVSNQVSANALWRNDGSAGFQRVAADLGSQSVGAAFLDYDNDGDLDLATTSLWSQTIGEELYHNRGSAGFVPMGTRLGLRRVSMGRALSYGDYDDDGRQDLLVADYEHAALYHNTVQAASWLDVEIQGRGDNRYGLGTRVELSVGGRRQMRDLESGYGYSSQVQPALHFGLGPALQVDSLQVRWPDGTCDLYTQLRINQHLVLAQPAAGKGAGEASAPPRLYSLQQNYPNPFNPQTTIAYQLPQTGPVRLVVYDMLGQRVRVLVDRVQGAGEYRVSWDGTDEVGRALGSGVYLYRLEAGPFRQARRLVLLR